MPQAMPYPFIPARHRWIFVAVSLVLLAIACALPAFTDSKGDSWVGINVLWCGVFGIFIGQIGWYANPVAAMALLTLALGWRKSTLVLAVFALFIALDSLLLIGASIPLDEGGVNHVQCTGMGLGFVFWMAYLATPAVAVLLARRPNQ